MAHCFYVPLAFMSTNSDSAPAIPSRSTDASQPMRPLSARDRVAAEALAKSLHAVCGILGDAVLTAGLRGRGYDVNAFQTGLTLRNAAEDVFVTYQTALSAYDRAADKFEEEWVQAREDYLEFRSMARSNSDGVAAVEFRVNGTVMPEFDGFIAQADASYASAQVPSLAAVLARHGFDAAKIVALTSQLRSLVELHATLDRLQAGVKRQLDERDIALSVFNLWVRELLQHARMVAGATFRPPSDIASHRQQLDAAWESSPAPRVRSHTATPRFGGRTQK